MKLNKNCQYFDECKTANEAMDAIWRYGCPAFVGSKKSAPFDQCMRFEEWKRIERDEANNRPL